jgi:hypothetical protein
LLDFRGERRVPDNYEDAATIPDDRFRPIPLELVSEVEASRHVTESARLCQR